MKKVTLICMILLALIACEDLIQEDIDGFGVVLLTPPANHSTSINVINFKWEEVPHADSYRIQIAKPSFNNPTEFVLDSLILGTEWSESLNPGDYEWRVRAENNISETAYYQRQLTITQTNDLTGQIPQLITPAQQFKSDETSLLFSWNVLPGAVDHRFKITDLDNTTDLVDNIVAADTFNWSSFPEGHFEWGVQAQNPTTSSQFAYRLFTIDRTAPSTPFQTAPADASSTTVGDVTFSWTSGVDMWTNVNDTLYITNLGNPLQIVVPSTVGTYTDSLPTGNYEWKIKTVDELGHFSVSSSWTLDVQ